jgi:hypothetical protein
VEAPASRPSEGQHGRHRRSAQAVRPALNLGGRGDHALAYRFVDGPPHRVAVNVAQAHRERVRRRRSEAQGVDDVFWAGTGHTIMLGVVFGVRAERC